MWIGITCIVIGSCILLYEVFKPISIIEGNDDFLIKFDYSVGDYDYTDYHYFNRNISIEEIENYGDNLVAELAAVLKDGMNMPQKIKWKRLN